MTLFFNNESKHVYNADLTSRSSTADVPTSHFFWQFSWNWKFCADHMWRLICNVWLNGFKSAHHKCFFVALFVFAEIWNLRLTDWLCFILSTGARLCSIILSAFVSFDTCENAYKYFTQWNDFFTRTMYVFFSLDFLFYYLPLVVDQCFNDVFFTDGRSVFCTRN